MPDKIKMQFLLKINSMTEQFIKEACDYVQENRDKVIREAVDSLRKPVHDVLDDYLILKDNGKVGTLRWIYLSFLHTGMIDHVLCYRIDLYDERNRTSDIECAVDWNAPYFSECLSMSKNRIQDEFDKQTQVCGYEMDPFMDRAMKRFRQEADCLLPEILQTVLQEAGLKYLGGEPVNILLGELFDYAAPILIWDEYGVRCWEAN